MGSIVISAALLSIIVYVVVGFFIGRRNKTLSDHLPIAAALGHARVRTAGEFSASTVATTISLATVVLAFFELAGYFGFWLLWTVITTALGILVVRLVAVRVCAKMSEFGDSRPTLHEFLGREYNSVTAGKIGAACTSLGFLGAFAVELTVGSRFLAGLVPEIPTGIAVICLASVGLLYTAVGGFRVVIVTDRIQMWSIWLLLAALLSFYYIYFSTHSGWQTNLRKLPPEMVNFSWREGLTPFLIGIFIINVPTFISDMSVWQRIAGSTEVTTVLRGLWRSLIGAAITWSLFVLFACLVPLVSPSQETNTNPLVLLINAIYYSPIGVRAGLVFCIVLGLYGAMFSTASTQLIALSHTIQTDLFSDRGGFGAKEEGPRAVTFSKAIIVGSAVIAMAIVGGLTAVGFSIADLVFAIYGAQLGLCPPVAVALLSKGHKTRSHGHACAMGIGAGFVIGWGMAIAGTLLHNTNVVFLAPAGSLFVSALILGLSFLNRTRPTVLSS